MKKLFTYILIPIIVGIVISFIMMPFNDYNELIKPPFAPPAILFPIVWTVLYALMGVSAYIISEKSGKLNIYYLQLFVNALWSIIFLVFKLRFLALIWLGLLIIFVIKMIYDFKKYNKFASYLQMPYLIWLFYAFYLNFGTFILN